jgi:selenocysteine-specific elongation factor
VGTAGHIDHGKTSLVKCLTGCETDTLPEEKARGMTIDLGFATCILPNDRRIGIVDVPGHERFIHNMVAGAAGIDVVMLVVAADDGVMPQTVEHFHIVRLLGITAGMVAITKIDMVEPERVAEVMEQVQALVEGSFLENAPIVPVSSKTGAGFDVFYDTFCALVDKTAQRDASGPFRLHVERSFVLKGLGTIVSGIPSSGSIEVGDSVVLLPAGETKRVKGIQVFGENAERGQAGECLAIRLSDVSIDDVGRGMVLAAPGYFTPTKIVNARFHLVPNLDKPLQPRTAIRLHIGTTEVTGHLVLPELEPMAPGQETYVQFQLNDPVVTAPGDFFVARLLSPFMTLGGGNVVSSETIKMRRRKGNWLEKIKERDESFNDPATTLTYALKEAGTEPLLLPDLARLAVLSEEVTRNHMAELVKNGIAAEFTGGRYTHTSVLANAREELLAKMNRLHDAAPLSMGFPKKDIIPDLKVHHLVLDKALAQLLEEGLLSLNPTGYQIPARAPKLSLAQSVISARLTELYKKTAFASPRRDELQVMMGIPAAVLDPILKFLLQTGELVAIEDKLLLHKSHIEASRRLLVDYLTKNKTMDSGMFKNLIASTRKYAIPLLEYWDAKGLTRREGNNRVLREVR